MNRSFAAAATRRILGRRGFEAVRAGVMAADIRSGRWSDEELELLPALVAPGDTVLDVGANFGLYSFHLSRLVGPQGQVLAFEPVPATHQTLRRVLRLLRARNVRTMRSGVGERAETITFTVPRATSESGRARMQVGDAGADHDVVSAEVVRLDDVVGSADVTFMKCDVEGAEARVLRGAQRLFSESSPTLLIEVSRHLLAGMGASPEELAGILRGHGYEAFRPATGPARLVPAEVGEDGNYVFVHPRRRDRADRLIQG